MYLFAYILERRGGKISWEYYGESKTYKLMWSIRYNLCTFAGVGLFHSPRRVPRRCCWFTRAVELSHVQDVLLSIWRNASKAALYFVWEIQSNRPHRFIVIFATQRGTGQESTRNAGAPLGKTVFVVTGALYCQYQLPHAHWLLTTHVGNFIG